MLQIRPLAPLDTHTNNPNDDGWCAIPKRDRHQPNGLEAKRLTRCSASNPEGVHRVFTVPSFKTWTSPKRGQAIRLQHRIRQVPFRTRGRDQSSTCRHVGKKRDHSSEASAQAPASARRSSLLSESCTVSARDAVESFHRRLNCGERFCD